MRCDECKVWDASKDTWAAPAHVTQLPPRMGVCNRPTMFWAQTEEGNGLVMAEHAKDLKMFVQDICDNAADLITRDDFFCAEFQAKEI